VLAVFAAIGGFIGITNITIRNSVPDNEALSVGQQLTEPLHSMFPMLCGLAAAVLGIGLA